MSSLTLLYICSAALGSIYILGSALAGQIFAHHHHDPSSPTQHGAAAQGSHGGHLSSEGQMLQGEHGHHGSDSIQAGVQHGAGAEAGQHSGTDAQIGPDAANSLQSGAGSSGQAHSGMHKHFHADFHLKHSANHHAKVHGGEKQIRSSFNADHSQNIKLKEDLPQLFVTLMTYLSPLRIAFLLFLFGSFGLLFSKFISESLSLVPALVVAWFLTKAYFVLSSKFMSRMYSSINFRKEDLIGAQGQLTVSIEAGSTGEVLVSSPGIGRYSSAARAKESGQSIKKLARVIVVDLKNDILIVEPFENGNVD